MKASDLASIPEDLSRFIQAHQFLKSLEESRKIATDIRDISLLRLREGENKIPQAKLADLIGVSQPRIHAMETYARNEQERRRRAGIPEPNFDQWIEDAQPLEL